MMEKKYTFSEISRIQYDKELKGKYICQIFNEKNEYIKSLIADTYEEVTKLQKKYKEIR